MAKAEKLANLERSVNLTALDSVWASLNSTPPPSLLLSTHDPHAEAVQVDVFHSLVGFAGCTAFERQAQEGEQAGFIAVVVVAVRIGVGFDEPAPRPAVGATVASLFLPAL